MTDFKSVMSKRTNTELLDITTFSRNEYQPEAVAAAEQELISRNLTEQQLTDANDELDLKQQENQKRNDRLKSIENKANEAINVFNPSVVKSIDKQIKIVSVVLAIAYLAYVVSDWGLTVLMIEDIGNADISSLLYFAPFILFPIGIFGFWMYKKYGWVILTFLFTYFTIATLFMAGFETVMAMQEPIPHDNSGPIQVYEVENTSFFEKNEIAFYIGQLILFVGFLFYMNRKTITERYQISRQTQLLAIGITASSLILFVLTMII